MSKHASKQVPKLEEGYQPLTVPQSLKVIHGQKIEGEALLQGFQAGRPEDAARHKFLHSPCLYLPTDDEAGICLWYEKHFQKKGTRTSDIYYEKAEIPGDNCAFITEINGESYDMYFARLETDCIDELYEHLCKSDEIVLEPLHNDGTKGKSFCYTDPQGNKFQVWQDARTKPQPMKDGVHAFIRVAALFFPVSDPEATLNWYTRYLGVDVSDEGHPRTESGLEFHFIKTTQHGRILNYIGQTMNSSTNKGEIPSMSIVNVAVDDLDNMHRRLLEDGQGMIEYIINSEGCGRSFQLADPDGNKLHIWEIQTILRVFRNAGEKVKGHYVYEDYGMKGNYHTFFEKVLTDPIDRRRVVRIKQYVDLMKEDPEGVDAQIELVKEFNAAHPDYALTVMYLDGKKYIVLL